MQRYTDLELMTWRSAVNVGSATINPREICRVAAGGEYYARSIVAVTQPDSTVGKSYCVNGPLPIAQGECGKVCFGPVVLVAYDTGSPATDDQYGPKSGQGTVSKDSNAIMSCMRVVDATNKLLLAKFNGGGGGFGIGKLTGSLSQGSYAPMDVWTCSGGTFAAVSPTNNINVYDWLMKVGSTAIASGKKVTYVMIGDTAVVWEAECP